MTAIAPLTHRGTDGGEVWMAQATQPNRGRLGCCTDRGRRPAPATGSWSSKPFYFGRSTGQVQVPS